MIRVIYVISNIDRWIAFEWIAEATRQSKFIEISFVLLTDGETYFQKWLGEQGISFCHFNFNGNKLLYPGLIVKLYKLFKKRKPEIVHTHFLDATVLGLTAALFAGIKHRIYTRHHSTYHHKFAKKGVYYDKYSNLLATKIIAISGVVEKVLLKKEQVPKGKVRTIPHGFHINCFSHPDQKQVNALKQKYNKKHRTPVIGVISRHIEWKGVQYTIEAYKEVLISYPNALLILVNARGSYSLELKQKLKDLPKVSFISIPFETDIEALYQLFDIFVHVPVDEDIEAFGQIYIESLAAGIPSIFTLSGIANDFIENEENALVVNYCDSDGIFNKIDQLLTDKELSDKLKSNGIKDVEKLFRFNDMMNKLNGIYGVA